MKWNLLPRSSTCLGKAFNWHEYFVIHLSDIFPISFQKYTFFTRMLLSINYRYLVAFLQVQKVLKFQIWKMHQFSTGLELN